VGDLQSTTASIPADEPERLALLRRLEILDTPRELDFDDFTELAATLCDAPMALISLVDAHRQWSKSWSGFALPESPRETSFCAHAILHADLFEVPDTHDEPRFRDHPWVLGEPHVRFYAACPLSLEGHHLGTLCVLDRHPRSLRPEQRTALFQLARRVVSKIESRLTRWRFAEQSRQLEAERDRVNAYIYDLYNAAPCGYHSLNEDGTFVAVNDTEARWLGYRPDEMVGQMKFTDLLTEAGKATFALNFQRFKAQGHIEDLEFDLVRKDGSLLPVLLNATAVRDAFGRMERSRSTIFDISRRKRAESERDRFFVLSPDMLCIADTAGRFKRVNPAFTEVLGYSAETLTERPFLEFVHPDDRAATEAETAKLAAGVPTLRFTNRYRHADGSWRWLSWRVQPDIAEGVLYATARDVTSERAAAEALRISEEKLSITLGSIGDGVLATDVSGCITLLNPVAETLSGWTQAEALGRPVEEVFRIIHAQTRQPAEVPVQAVLQTGAIHGLANHTVLIARDGSERPIADSAAPIRDRAGAVIGVVLVFRDQSEEYLARQAQHALSARMAFLLTSTGAVVYARRVDPDHELTYVSPNCREVLGAPAQSLLGPTGWSEHLHPDEREGVLAWIDQLRTVGESVSREYRYLHRDGSWRWIHDALRLVRDVDGRPLEFVGAWTDLTMAEIKAAHDGLERMVAARTEELRQSQARISQSLHEKETLLKEIHHRVKNNLQIIGSLLAWQAETLPDPGLRAPFEESIRRLRSMSLIHERLYQSDALGSMDFGGYTESLSNFLFRSYEITGRIRIRVEADPCTLNIDTAVPCGLILNELISNALKHAFPDGHTGEVVVTLRSVPGGRFCLGVHDDGVGLPEGFDPARTTSLGMQLVTSLTRQIKGTLTITRDRGTGFRIEFKELTYGTR